jgi:hypothetical protein
MNPMVVIDGKTRAAPFGLETGTAKVDLWTGSKARTALTQFPQEGCARQAGIECASCW